MRAVVTGGAGFIGSNLVDRLVGLGFDVVVLDDLSAGYRENINPKAEFIMGSIVDEDVVDRALEGADIVYHQAAHRAVLRSVEHPLETNRANVHGTLNILEKAVKNRVKRVVSASSSSIYGNISEFPTRENAQKLPKSPYAVSKLAGEHYCRVFHELYSLETVSLRYFNVYGPRQRPESAYAAVIPLFIRALKDGDPPQVHGDGLQSRDFSYIDDVVDANIAAGTADSNLCSGKAYNIAGGATYSLLDLLSLLRQLTGIDVEPVFTDVRPGDVRKTQADISQAFHDLGFVPKIDFRQGLMQTVEYFS